MELVYQRQTLRVGACWSEFKYPQGAEKAKGRALNIHGIYIFNDPKCIFLPPDLFQTIFFSGEHLGLKPKIVRDLEPALPK